MGDHNVFIDVLLPAMKEVGDKFGAGELILPFVLKSAECMKSAVAELEKYFRALSTPSLPGLGVDKLFSASTQEHFYFKCPSCSRRIELRFPDSLVITAEKHNDPSILDSHLICYECKAILPHEAKADFLKTGKFEATNSSHERGMYINQLYSSTAHPYEAAIEYLKGLADRFYEQEFWNSVMGLAHVVEGASVNDKDIINCTGNYHMNDMFKADGIRCMGVDVGHSALHYVVKVYKPTNNTSTLINENMQARYLGIGTAKDWQELARLVSRYRPQSFIVDAMPETYQSKSFVSHYSGIGKMCYYNHNMKERSVGLSGEDPRERKH